MKKPTDRLFIFIATIIIGILITINLKHSRTASIFKMNASEYKDATEERNVLLEEIRNLHEDNNNMAEKITDYQLGGEKSINIVTDMKDQLVDYSLINGKTEVTGPGIVLKLNDAPYSITEDTAVEIGRRTLHDIDVAMILNELRAAGAEVLAINSYRITTDTSVDCGWAFIGFNDKEQTIEEAPFYFYAIGDPEQLETAIFAEGSYINKLIIRQLEVELEKKDNIVIPASSRKDEPQFMKRIKN